MRYTKSRTLLFTLLYASSYLSIPNILMSRGEGPKMGCLGSSKVLIRLCLPPAGCLDSSHALALLEGNFDDLVAWVWRRDAACRGPLRGTRSSSSIVTISCRAICHCQFTPACCLDVLRLQLMKQTASVNLRRGVAGCSCLSETLKYWNDQTGSVTTRYPKQQIWLRTALCGG